MREVGEGQESWRQLRMGNAGDYECIALPP